MNKIKTLTIKFGVPYGTLLNQSIGSVMQGVMMEHISTQYAAKLHEQGLNPYSQYSVFDRKKNTLTWTLNSLNNEADEKIIDVLMENLPTVIRLKKKQCNLTLISKQITNETSYEQLAQQYLSNNCPTYKRVDYKFITSASFKNNHEYMIFPNQFFIMNSLLNRWNAFAGENAVVEQDLALNLAKQTIVATYDLKLVPFYLERTKIPAFRGDYSLYIKTDSILKNVIYLLSAYAPFAGVGIKTSVGMGAINTKLNL